MESTLFELPKAYLLGPDSSDENGAPFRTPSIEVCGGGKIYKERPEIRYFLEEMSGGKLIGFVLLTDEGTLWRCAIEPGRIYKLTAYVLGRGEGKLEDNPNGKCIFFVSHVVEEDSKKELEMKWVSPIEELAEVS